MIAVILSRSGEPLSNAVFIYLIDWFYAYDRLKLTNHFFMSGGPRIPTVWQGVY
ncbi:hypothetical protein ECA1765 [Pectobacterium atrosepticum SCRI1043]|uniref:Uncharacterized protein n=1 Tax=Pectobacterium atrosepticum (strain SCRI 1043 / ATCC BAA-672) TaxID=218491 RepID=Q6D6C0_PECAS|nr:hypothetical protein ECA1765 [Pectobacterium atrosepticum SCRI1043]